MSATAEPSGLWSITGRQWLILLMVQLANLLFGMTITLANLVLPQIRGTLSATQDEISWVITLNLIATAVATPMTGWLADRLGWRTMMFGTLTGFTIASFLCGVAGSLETLILARVLQGIFGAPIMPLGQAILLATFSPRMQPTAMALWGVGTMFGPVFGPILGSYATEAYNWRWAFFMVVPASLAALACTWFALSQHTERKAIRLDWTGFLALSVSIVCAQLVFDRGQRLDWFESYDIIAYTFVGVLAFWIFAVHCLTAKDPFLNPRLLRDRNFTVGLVIAFVLGMLSYIGLVLMPTLLHDLRGYPDTEIGLLIASRGVGNWIAFLFIAKLTRAAPRFAIGLGLTLQAVSGFWLASLGLDITEFDVIATNMLQGLGMSVSFTPIIVMSFSTLPKHQIAEGTGVFTMVRNFGSSLFVSMSVLVFVRSTSTKYAELAEYIAPHRMGLLYPAMPESWNPETVAGLARLSREVQRQAAMIGYINAFHMLGICAALAVPLVLLLRKKPEAV